MKGRLREEEDERVGRREDEMKTEAKEAI